jgi:hypothetical protein
MKIFLVTKKIFSSYNTIYTGIVSQDNQLN